jgi:hypothetical protein
MIGNEPAITGTLTVTPLCSKGCGGITNGIDPNSFRYYGQPAFPTGAPNQNPVGGPYGSLTAVAGALSNQFVANASRSSSGTG